MSGYRPGLSCAKIGIQTGQAKTGSLSNGTPCLVLYSTSGEEYFNFQSRNKEKIKLFINEINKLYGVPVSKKSNKISDEDEDDDSIKGAFKEVGNAFKEVGQEFVAAFGFKSKKKDEDIDDEDEDDEEENEEDVVSKYQLEEDEVIIKNCECVYIDGTIENTADIVLLTNKRLVIEYTTGFWNNKQHIDKFDFTDIKVYKGQPQVKLGNHNDSPVLEIYFSNAQLFLNFEEVGSEKKQKVFISEWVNEISDIFFSLNNNKSKEEKKIEARPCESCGRQVPVTATFCKHCGKPLVSYKQEGLVCKQCGKPNKIGLKFCVECGSKLDEIQTTSNISGISNLTSERTGNENSTEQKQKLTMDQQIEMLQKLKSLVDTGVLSQEEFEAKKKEIL